MPYFETAYSVPKRLELTTLFILKLLSISVDRCSLFLSLLEVHISGERIFNSATVVSRKVGFPCLTPRDERNRTSASSRLLLTVPWPEKRGLLFDFYHPKWEKEYVFELEESFTDWVIQVYSLIFLRRI